MAVCKARVLEDNYLVLPSRHQYFTTAIRMFSSTVHLDESDVTVLARTWSTVDALNAILSAI